MRARAINALIWSYLGLSDACTPVTTPSDTFLSQKAAQLFRVNHLLSGGDIPEFLGLSLLLVGVGFAIDRIIGRRGRAASHKSNITPT